MITDIKEYQRQWYLKNKKQHNKNSRDNYKKNRNAVLKRTGEYAKTPKGSEINRMAVKKQNAYKKGLGFEIKYPNIIKGKVAYHHINNKEVVAIPYDIHCLYPFDDIIKHRFMCKQIVKQIYGDE